MDEEYILRLKPHKREREFKAFVLAGYLTNTYRTYYGVEIYTNTYTNICQVVDWPILNTKMCQ